MKWKVIFVFHGKSSLDFKFLFEMATNVLHIFTTYAVKFLPPDYADYFYHLFGQIFTTYQIDW